MVRKGQCVFGNEKAGKAPLRAVLPVMQQERDSPVKTNLRGLCRDVNSARAWWVFRRGPNATTRGLEAASSMVRFPSAGQAASATETEQVGIAICSAEEIIPDDFDGDEAEGDAIATVAQRKTGMREPREERGGA